MKRTTPTPDFTIKQVGNDCFKVFDRNQHFRSSAPAVTAPIELPPAPQNWSVTVR